MVDYDLDHDLDIYISVVGEANKLFQNQGDGTFLDHTAVAEVGHTGLSTGIAWGDLVGADASAVTAGGEGCGRPASKASL